VSGHTENSVEVDANIDTVWRLTNELERWPVLFTEYAKVEIVEHDGPTWRFRLTMHPDPQGNVWSWLSERTLDEARHRVTARRIEPGWFESMDITWTYEALGNRTRMTWVQDFSMRADSPFDDVAMTERINRNTAIQIAHVRDEVERLAARPVPSVGRHFASVETP
jgi:aromatase